MPTVICAQGGHETPECDGLQLCCRGRTDARILKPTAGQPHRPSGFSSPPSRTAELEGGADPEGIPPGGRQPSSRRWSPRRPTPEAQPTAVSRLHNTEVFPQT